MLRLRLLQGAASAGPVVDLFVVVGQSNAEGRGSSASSPASPTGIAVSTAGVITEPLADPVGGATTGSMWPAFANGWYASAGRNAAICEAATGGTALLPDQAGSNWSPSGTLRAGAVTAANAAIAAINASAYTLGNVYFLWCQGEQDGTNVNGTTITGPLYNTALQALAAYFRAQVPSAVTVGVVRTGREANETYISGYIAIQEAQDAACAASGDLTMLYRGSHSFVARNWMTDFVHWDQSGLNLAGKVAAEALAVGGAAAVAAAPSVLATSNYVDPLYTASVGRSASHTTAAGTKCITVCVSVCRPESNTTVFTTAVTFGGVAMTLAFAEKASQSTSPAGRANSAIYYLNEREFGSSLSAAAGSVAVSVASSNIISWCVVDIDQQCLPDAVYFYAPTNVTIDNGTVSAVTSGPSLVIGIGSSVSDAAAPLTATLVNLTEVMDDGLVNAGTTRSGQMVVGHARETAAVLAKTYSATWTAACTGVAWVVAAFRQLIDGE